MAKTTLSQRLRNRRGERERELQVFPSIQPQWNHQGQQALLKQMLTGHSQGFPFRVCPQLMLSWEMNARRLIQSADWEGSNLKAKVRMSHLGSEYIPRQSISQYRPYNVSSFKRPLWHFQFSAKRVVSPDSCYVTRRTILEWHFLKQCVSLD